MSEVFVSLPFDERFTEVFRTVKGVAAEHGLTAIRIDQVSALAHPVADDTRRSVRRARVVIAEVTGASANVFNEIGMAQAMGKPIVLLTQDDPTIAPFNIKHLQIHRYKQGDVSSLQPVVAKALREATSPNELLRSMLVPGTLGAPSRESWFVIAASPLSYRRARGRKGGYKELYRTSSDYVGIRGIMQSFGLLFGFDTLPDNIDPHDCDDTVLNEAMNIYCIASPKTNRWTGDILAEFGKRWAPSIGFQADPKSPDLRNVRVCIISDSNMVSPPGWNLDDERDRYSRDFGIVVRGPNPYHLDHMAVVIAGRSSLGTEAASLAFTQPKAIEKIRRELLGQDTDLEDHKQAFWVLASMERGLGGSHLRADHSTLQIELVRALKKRK